MLFRTGIAQGRPQGGRYIQIYRYTDYRYAEIYRIQRHTDIQTCRDIQIGSDM